MTFSDVQSAVQQTWEFAWPPVLEMAVAIALFAWLAPGTFGQLKARMATLEVEGSLKRTVAAFRLFGVKSLFPVMVLFVLVFCLYITNRTILTVGSILPPSITYDLDQLTKTNLIDRRALVCIMALTAKTQDFGTLPAPMQIRLVEAAAEVMVRRVREAKTDQYWQNEADKAFSRIVIGKFFALFIVVVLVVERRRGFRLRARRVILAVGVLTVFLSLSMINHLYAMATANENAVVQVSRQMLAEEACSEFGSAWLTDAQLEVLRGDVERRGWWSFSLSPLREVQWVWAGVTQRLGLSYPLLRHK